MLRRYVSVSNTGEIKKKGDPKVSYATMMSIRQHISCASPKTYSLAIITAARYSCWRKQFQNSSGIEQPVIEYQTQMNKIIPRVAEYFAMMIGGNNIRKITDQNFKNVKEHENFSLMNETHACLCLGKAFYTETTFNGMEICRKACGGHGFSHYSGMPAIIFEYSSNLTMEG
jgi:acyl-CoA oxidase